MNGDGMSRTREFLGTVAIWQYVSVWEIFVIPMHLALGYALWTVPMEQRAGVPFWDAFQAVASLEAWAVAVWSATIALLIGFAQSNLWMIRLGYAALFAFWVFVSIIGILQSPTLFGLTLYLSLANACILRQATLTYQARAGSDG